MFQLHFCFRSRFYWRLTRDGGGQQQQWQQTIEDECTKNSFVNLAHENQSMLLCVCVCGLWWTQSLWRKKSDYQKNNRKIMDIGHRFMTFVRLRVHKIFTPPFCTALFICFRFSLIHNAHTHTLARTQRAQQQPNVTCKIADASNRINFDWILHFGSEHELTKKMYIIHFPSFSLFLRAPFTGVYMCMNVVRCYRALTVHQLKQF